MAEEPIDARLRDVVGQAVEAVGVCCGAIVLRDKGAEKLCGAACARSKEPAERFAVWVLPLASWARPLALVSEKGAREITNAWLNPQAFPIESGPRRGTKVRV